MLASLIRCATCGRRFHGHRDSKPGHIRRYYCSKIQQTPAVRKHRPCGQKSVHCDVLDAAVWDVITQTLLNPDVLLNAINDLYSNDRVIGIREQIAFLEKQISSIDNEEQKLYKAYIAEVFTVEEYAAERQRVTQQRDVLKAELQKLQSQVISPTELEQRKQATLELVEHARQHVDLHEAPFELKMQITRLLVDEILLNVNEGWFELKGTIGAGLYSLQETPVAGTSNLLRQKSRSGNRAGWWATQGLPGHRPG